MFVSSSNYRITASVQPSVDELVTLVVDRDLRAEHSSRYYACARRSRSAFRASFAPTRAEPPRGLADGSAGCLKQSF